MKTIALIFGLTVITCTFMALVALMTICETIREVSAQQQPRVRVLVIPAGEEGNDLPLPKA